MRDTLRAENNASTSTRVRVAVVIAAIAVGYAVAKDIPEIRPALWFGCAAGACAIGAASRSWVLRVSLILTVVLLAGGWFAHRIHGASRVGLRATIAEAGGEMLLAVEGVAISDPRRTEPDRRGMGRSRSPKPRGTSISAARASASKRRPERCASGSGAIRARRQGRAIGFA